MLIQCEQTVCNIISLSYVIVITGIEKNNKYFKFSVNAVIMIISDLQQNKHTKALNTLQIQYIFTIE